MKFTIPPKFDALRRQVAGSHNRRVMLLMLGLGAIIVAVVLPLLRLHQTEMLIVLVVVAVLAEIFGIISIIRLSKRQSIALGYACPLCGGALYDGGSNRLGNRGECPCCKKYIIETLNEGRAQ